MVVVQRSADRSTSRIDASFRFSQQLLPGSREFRQQLFRQRSRVYGVGVAEDDDRRAPFGDADEGVASAVGSAVLGVASDAVLGAHRPSRRAAISLLLHVGGPIGREAAVVAEVAIALEPELESVQLVHVRLHLAAGW